MAYYDRKRYEELRGQILWLQNLWNRGKKMAELKLLAAALVLFGVLYFVWRD